MKRGKSKKAQNVFGLSFGVIFSILLIIFFIVVAFIAINAFLKTQKCTQIGIFIDDFEVEINKAWNSQSSSFEFQGTLPSNLDSVCFTSQEEKNLFLSPKAKACIPEYNIEHLDIEKITQSQDPYCIDINKGDIDIQIEKGFNDALVGIR